MSLLAVFKSMDPEEQRLLARKLDLSVSDVEAELRDAYSLRSQHRNNELLTAVLIKSVDEFIAWLRLENILSAQRAEELLALLPRETRTVMPVTAPVSTVPAPQQPASNDAIKAADRRINRAQQNFDRAEDRLWAAMANPLEDAANQMALGLAPNDPELRPQIIDRARQGFNQMRPHMAHSVQRVAEGHDYRLVLQQTRQRALQVLEGLLRDCIRVEERAKDKIAVIVDQFLHGYYANAGELLKAAHELQAAQAAKASLLSQVGIYPHPAPSAGDQMLGRAGVASAPNQRDLGPDTATPQNKNTQPPGGPKFEPSARRLSEEDLQHIVGQPAANITLRKN